MIEIRKEQLQDYDGVRLVNDRAFGQDEEGRIVDKLRQSCENIISLVAISDDKIKGHIFFSPVTIETPNGLVNGMGLAPMAVLPECQREGIGSMLVEHGLGILQDRCCLFVIVLGHPEYYPRFGFELASKYGLKCQWDGVPDEAFMVKIFDEAAIKGVSGVARYRDEFNEAM